MSRTQISSEDIPTMPPLSRKIIFFLMDRNWHSRSEIKRYTKAPSSTLILYFKRLIEAGWIERDKDRKGKGGTRYRLSPIKKITDESILEFQEKTISPYNWDGPIGTMHLDVNLFNTYYRRKWTSAENELVQQIQKIKSIWMENALWRYDTIVNEICSRASQSDKIILRGFFMNYLEHWMSLNNLPKNSLYRDLKETILCSSEKKITQQLQKMENEMNVLKTYIDNNGNNVAETIAIIQSYKNVTYTEALDYAIRNKDLDLSMKALFEIKNILMTNEKIEKYLLDYWNEEKKLKKKKKTRIPILLPRTPPIIILDSNKSDLHEGMAK